ncbi:hypothetical protein [Thalassobaculum sp.]|uniref:hypothetical protein n=1 Tax=Thalassobaculum sp. TaxID=2022740 RepID=UPI0032EB234E
MAISRAACISPAPGFLIRHVSFLELDLPLKNATLEWLEQSKAGSVQILSNPVVCDSKSFIFSEATGDLINESALVSAFGNTHYHIEIAKKIYGTLGEIESPMALNFSTTDGNDAGLQFIVLPVDTRSDRLHLLRVAGW